MTLTHSRPPLPAWTSEKSYPKCVFGFHHALSLYMPYLRWTARVSSTENHRSYPRAAQILSTGPAPSRPRLVANSNGKEHLRTNFTSSFRRSRTSGRAYDHMDGSQVLTGLGPSSNDVIESGSCAFFVTCGLCKDHGQRGSLRGWGWSVAMPRPSLGQGEQTWNVTVAIP